MPAPAESEFLHEYLQLELNDIYLSVLTADPNKSNIFNSFPVGISATIKMTQNHLPSRISFFVIYFRSLSRRHCCLCLLDVEIRKESCMYCIPSSSTIYFDAIRSEIHAQDV